MWDYLDLRFTCAVTYITEIIPQCIRFNRADSVDQAGIADDATDNCPSEEEQGENRYRLILAWAASLGLAVSFSKP